MQAAGKDLFLLIFPAAAGWLILQRGGDFRGTGGGWALQVWHSQ